MTTPDGHSPNDLLNRSWDENARAWTTTVRERRIESRRVVTDRAIIDAVLQHSPRRLVDVGCGEGWLCRALGKHGIRCVGVDGSSDLIRAAQSADQEGEYHLLRYEHFDRPSGIVALGMMDLAVCNFALLHEEIVSTLTAVRGILRPGGTLLIQTVHPWTDGGTSAYVDGWRTEDFAWSACPFPRPMPWYFRTLESWTSTIRGSGYVLDGVLEPADPESKRPLSLLLRAIRQGV